MAKVTRIKAKDPDEDTTQPKKATTKKVKTAKTSVKATTAKVKKPEVKPTKSKATVKPTKKPFILVRPLIYFGRYIRDSWQEIRQVSWPSRKVTWKLFLAILIYTLIFVAVIMLLDALFTWLFNTVLS